MYLFLSELYFPICDLRACGEPSTMHVSLNESNLFSTNVAEVMPLKNGIHLNITENRKGSFMLSQE